MNNRLGKGRILIVQHVHLSSESTSTNDVVLLYKPPYYFNF